MTCVKIATLFFPFPAKYYICHIAPGIHHFFTIIPAIFAKDTSQQFRAGRKQYPFSLVDFYTLLFLQP
jgi:hypothetical protein